MNWLGAAFNGIPVGAIDGAVGDLADLLFDDDTWQVRWLVVDTGRWLDGRRLLIHPSSIQKASGQIAALKVYLTRSQLRNSPFIESDAPLSMQMERSLNCYYGYDPDLRGAWPHRGGVLSESLSCQETKMAVPLLRRFAEVEGFLIHATDGDAGFLKNVVVDDEFWRVNNIVVDVPSWRSVKHVVVPTASVEGIGWQRREIWVDMTRKEIATSTPVCQTGMVLGACRGVSRAYRAWKSRAHEVVGGA